MRELLAMAILLTLGCGASERPQPQRPAKSVRTSQGRELEGVRVSIDETRWEDFIRSKIVVRLFDDDSCEIDKTHFSDDKLAFEALDRLASENQRTGIVVFRTKRDRIGSMSFKSIEDLCKRYGVDCLMEESVGGFDVGSERKRAIKLLWTVESGHDG